MGITIPGPYGAYAKDVYSQNGEDGIVAKLFSDMDIDSGWCVECGANNGVRLSNTLALVQQGWYSLMIEASPDYKKVLNGLATAYCGRIRVASEYAEAEDEHSLDAIAERHGVPEDFELLSLDIEGQEYHLWNHFHNHKAKVAIIEINSSYPLTARVVPYRPRRGSDSGTSFTPMLELGLSKGYTLVAHTGNIIFVLNDYVNRLNLPREVIDHPERLFVQRC